MTFEHRRYHYPFKSLTTTMQFIIVVQYWNYQNKSPRSIPYHATIMGSEPKMVLIPNYMFSIRPEVGRAMWNLPY